MGMDVLGINVFEHGRAYGMTRAWMLSEWVVLKHGRNQDVGMRQNQKATSMDVISACTWAFADDSQSISQPACQ